MYKQKAGTTAHDERPWCAHFELSTEGLQQVDVLDVLVKTKMAQSRAEARRIIQQGRVWDCDVVESYNLINDKGRVIQVVTKLSPEEKYVFAEPGNRWIVGKPVFVPTSRGKILDLTQGKIILFTLAPKNNLRCNSGVAARVVRWFLGRFRSK